MMPAVLCFTIRFLDPVPRFHGRGDSGDPEWPPSPLRFFQALVCAAANRWREGQFNEYAAPALKWLEAMPPEIVTPPVRGESFGYRMYVPNNSGDLMTAAWARGDTETSMAKFRVEKDVRPTHLTGDAVHYLFPLADGDAAFEQHRATLEAAARSVTHLGWGVDMVAGNARVLDEKQVAELTGEVWRPAADNDGTPLRVPIDGTLDALVEKHAKFLGRLSADGFKPVPPLSAFAVRHYRRATDSVSRPWTAFQILKPDASGYCSFDTPRRTRDVAAWVRHATGEVCEGWPWPDRATFVHGHDPLDHAKQAKGEAADRRFQYLPVPSIERRGDLGNKVGAIRRVLIAAPPGCQDRIDFIRRRLPGQELTWDGKPVGLLNILPTGDWVLRQYIEPATVWSTVTPVILPGYDDRNAGKAETLLRNAFLHAGFSPELVNAVDDLQWRNVGFRAGVDPATSYRRPDRLTGGLYHVRVRFPHPVRGPLAVGAGRYRGLGLFAGEAGW